MRRYLNFSMEEWDKLPWWQQRMYGENLIQELRNQQGQQGQQGSGGQQPNDNGSSGDITDLVPAKQM